MLSSFSNDPFPKCQTGFKILSILILSFFWNLNTLSAQQKKPVKIVRADVLKSVEKHGVRMKKLAGNVILRQKDVTMHCDSALFHTESNSVDAFGHVHIEQGDSLNIYSDSLKYSGDEKQAALFGNVRLKDGQANLKTDRLDYNLETKTASYYSGAELFDGESVLTSKRGHYHEPTGMAFFKDSVRLNNPDYQLLSDTLNYHVRSKTAWFFGPTQIFNNKTDIYCETGWYNTNSGFSSFGQNTKLISEAQKLKTDSLYYDMNSGYGKVLKKFDWTDTSQNLTIRGTHAIYHREKEYLLASQRPLLINLIEGDSLFLAADTLESINDTTLNARKFLAYHHVRIFKSDLQAVCDSAHFSYSDSLFTLFDEPVIWSDNSQLTGDTICLQMRNNKIDKVILKQHAFIVNESSKELYDQISGRTITGYFKSSKIDNMKVEGNGQSVYFGQDDEGRYVGVNKAVCSDMFIHFKESKVNRITFLEKPEASFIPMQQSKPEKLRLDGFKWLEELKPLSKFDLNRKTGVENDVEEKLGE